LNRLNLLGFRGLFWTAFIGQVLSELLDAGIYGHNLGPANFLVAGFVASAFSRRDAVELVAHS
jgi:hypothetical protein